MEVELRKIRNVRIGYDFIGFQCPYSGCKSARISLESLKMHYMSKHRRKLEII